MKGCVLLKIHDEFYKYIAFWHALVCLCWHDQGTYTSTMILGIS